jgi:hypothetical protein
MDWTLFIFKRSNHHYLVMAGSQEDAYIELARKQSCRVEIAKKEYKFIKHMNGFGMETVVKL